MNEETIKKMLANFLNKINTIEHNKTKNIIWKRIYSIAKKHNSAEDKANWKLHVGKFILYFNAIIVLRNR